MNVKFLGGDSFYDLAVLEFLTTPGSEISTVDFTKTEPMVGDRVLQLETLWEVILIV